MYTMEPNLVHIGLVVGLDYENPYLNPYEEFQRFKTHKAIRKFLDGGECISYGARCLNEGGYYAIPKLTFPGGMLAGDSAGFLNVAKVKGTHNAMKTGMLAAESIYNKLEAGQELAGAEITEYEQNVRDSRVVKELKEGRNFKGGFERGLWAGIVHGALVGLTKGKEPWSIPNRTRDSDST